MTSVKLRSHVGLDGILRFELPVGMTEMDLEVMVIFQPLHFISTPKEKSLEELGWRPGFFEETAGKWAGEPLVREPQGEYEIRKPLE